MLEQQLLCCTQFCIVKTRESLSKFSQAAVGIVDMYAFRMTQKVFIKR